MDRRRRRWYICTSSGDSGMESSLFIWGFLVTQYNNLPISREKTWPSRTQEGLCSFSKRNSSNNGNTLTILIKDLQNQLVNFTFHKASLGEWN